MLERKKFLILVVIVVVVVIAGYSLVTSDARKTVPAPALMPRYVAAEGKVETVAGGQIEVGIDLLSARIATMNVKEGDDVKKGDVLATLLSTDLDAKVDGAKREVAAARARLAEVAAGARREELQKARAALDAVLADAVRAKADYERSSELHRQGLLSDAAFDERVSIEKASRARVREAEAGLRLLKAGPKPETVRFYKESVRRAEAELDYFKSLLEKTVIRSPIDGRVIRKNLNVGESVVPETPILAVADIDALQVNAEVDETDAGRIHLADPVEIASDAFPDKVYKGVVEEIADYVGPRAFRPNNPAKNRDMKVIQVKVRFIDKTPFKIGMTVDIRITPNGKEPKGG